MWLLRSCINNILANLDAGGERLLTKDMEVLLDSLEGLLGMYRGCGADHYGF
jgi:hypothetical protein